MLELNTYYDCKRDLLDKYPDYISYFVISNRGAGKTYSFKHYLIDQYLTNGERFCYLRRYKDERKNSQRSFLSDLNLQDFPGCEFKNKGNAFYINNKIAGYFFAFTDQTKIRSTAIPEIDRKKIYNFIFDECLFIKGSSSFIGGGDGYKEVPILLEIISTLARDCPFRLFILSNMTDTLFNGYFRFFNLRPDIAYDNGWEFCKSKDNPHMLLQFVNNEGFVKQMKKTAFGQLATCCDSTYSDYALNNKSARETKNKDLFIQKRPKQAQRCVITIWMDGKHYGVWVDNSNPIFYLDSAYNPSSDFTISLTSEDMRIDSSHVRSVKNMSIWKTLVDAYYNNRLKCSNNQVKAAWDKMLDMTGVRV